MKFCKLHYFNDPQNKIEMNKKEQQAIDFLRSMERDDLLSLGFSGGKDSVVILDLAERAGIKYNAFTPTPQ